MKLIAYANGFPIFYLATRYVRRSEPRWYLLTPYGDYLYPFHRAGAAVKCGLRMLPPSTGFFRRPVA